MEEMFGYPNNYVIINEFNDDELKTLRNKIETSKKIMLVDDRPFLITFRTPCSSASAQFTKFDADGTRFYAIRHSSNSCVKDNELLFDKKLLGVYNQTESLVPIKGCAIDRKSHVYTFNTIDFGSYEILKKEKNYRDKGILIDNMFKILKMLHDKKIFLGSCAHPSCILVKKNDDNLLFLTDLTCCFESTIESIDQHEYNKHYLKDWLSIILITYNIKYQKTLGNNFQGDGRKSKTNFITHAELVSKYVSLEMFGNINRIVQQIVEQKHTVFKINETQEQKSELEEEPKEELKANENRPNDVKLGDVVQHKEEKMPEKQIQNPNVRVHEEKQVQEQWIEYSQFNAVQDDIKDELCDAQTFNPYEAGITDTDKGIMYRLLKFTADNSEFSKNGNLLTNKERMEKNGFCTKAHPLRTIEYILCDTKVRKQLNIICDHGFVWNGYKTSTGKTLQAQHERDNILPYIYDFADTVGGDAKHMTTLINTKVKPYFGEPYINWGAFLEYLVNLKGKCKIKKAKQERVPVQEPDHEQEGEGAAGPADNVRSTEQEPGANETQVNAQEKEVDEHETGEGEGQGNQSDRQSYKGPQNPKSSPQHQQQSSQQQQHQQQSPQQPQQQRSQPYQQQRSLTADDIKRLADAYNKMSAIQRIEIVEQACTDYDNDNQECTIYCNTKPIDVPLMFRIRMRVNGIARCFNIQHIYEYQNLRHEWAKYSSKQSLKTNYHKKFTKDVFTDEQKEALREKYKLMHERYVDEVISFIKKYVKIERLERSYTYNIVGNGTTTRPAYEMTSKDGKRVYLKTVLDETYTTQDGYQDKRSVMYVNGCGFSTHIQYTAGLYDRLGYAGDISDRPQHSLYFVNNATGNKILDYISKFEIFSDGITGEQYFLENSQKVLVPFGIYQARFDAPSRMNWSK